jgi:hypothetical protein
MPRTLIACALFVGGCTLAPAPFDGVAHAETCTVTTTLPGGKTITVDIECPAGQDTTSHSGAGSGSPGPDCTPWAPFLGDSVFTVTSPNTRTAADGALETLSIRICTPGGKEYLWVSSPTGRSVAGQAYRDLQSKGLPAPVAITGPPLDKMIVNFDTWIAVRPEAPVTATAAAGGITAEVTATPVRIEFHTGTISAKDVAVVACDPWGSIDFGICTWTPQFPSVPQATGTDDLTYHGSISIIWDVAWTSSTGANGTQDQMSTTTPLKITVMEIQTIGSG